MPKISDFQVGVCRQCWGRAWTDRHPRVSDWTTLESYGMPYGSISFGLWTQPMEIIRIRAACLWDILPSPHPMSGNHNSAIWPSEVVGLGPRNSWQKTTHGVCLTTGRLRVLVPRRLRTCPQGDPEIRPSCWIFQFYNGYTSCLDSYPLVPRRPAALVSQDISC